MPEYIQASGLVEVESAWGRQGSHRQKFELILLPEVDIELPGPWRATAIGRLRSELFDTIEPVRRQDEVARLSRRLFLGDRSAAELREFYVEGPLGRSYLTLGKQQIVWGQADGLKVLDAVNPQVFREFILDDFDASRIPLWAAVAEFPLAGFAVQAVWVPENTYHDIPVDESLFRFRSTQLRPEAPRGVSLDFMPAERPDKPLADADWGLRISRFWRGWDLSWNYLYHYHDVPAFEQELALSSFRLRDEISPTYRRSHLLGGTFSNAFGALVVRGEFAYASNRFHITDDPLTMKGLAQSDEGSYVLGVDWFGLDETFVSGQIFQNGLFDDPPNIARRRLDTNVSLFLQREFAHDRWQAEVFWLHAWGLGDGLVRPKINGELSDQVTGWIGVDLFYGSRNGLFGQFDALDRVVIGAQWGID